MDRVEQPRDKPPAEPAGRHPLLARSAFLRLHVMIRRIADRDRMATLRNDHLAWMIAQEKAGLVVMSGPLEPVDAATSIDGLTLIRAASADQASELASRDPYIIGGAMTFELRTWTVVEGCLPLTLTLSDSSFSLA